MLKDLDITPEDPEELRAVNRLLADEVKSQALLIEKLKHLEPPPLKWSAPMIRKPEDLRWP